MNNNFYQDLDLFNVQEFISQKKSPTILLMIPNELINKYIVLCAAEANGMSIRHAPIEFLSRKVMEAAVVNNFHSFNLIPKRLIYTRLVFVFGISLIDSLEKQKNIKLPQL